MFDEFISRNAYISNNHCILSVGQVRAFRLDLIQRIIRKYFAHISMIDRNAKVIPSDIQLHLELFKNSLIGDIE